MNFNQVLDTYKNMGLNVKGIDAKDMFYSELKGKTDPKQNAKPLADCSSMFSRKKPEGQWS